MGQTRLSSIAIINIEKSYANGILQESKDRIIDIFGKKKINIFFFFSILDPISTCFKYFVILC